MKTPIRLPALWLALNLVVVPATAAVVKCTDAAGKVTYQTGPCPDASNSTSLPNVAAPAARPAPAPSRSSPKDSWGIVTEDGVIEAPAPDAGNRARQARRPDQPALPELPRVRLAFDLLSTDGQRLPWTNTGPKDGRRWEGRIRGGSMAEDAPLAAVMHENGREGYSLEGGSTLAWMPKGFSGPKQEITPPSRLPRLSWASGLAWDTSRNILAIVSTGSEGYFYRYDTRNHTWLDARSLKNRDLLALTFDPVHNRFVGITEGAELVTFNDQGSLQQTYPLADRLPGLRTEHGYAPGLMLAARGGVVAIINISQASVTHIWTFEQASDRVQLTYKSSGRNP